MCYGAKRWYHTSASYQTSVSHYKILPLHKLGVFPSWYHLVFYEGTSLVLLACLAETANHSGDDIRLPGHHKHLGRIYAHHETRVSSKKVSTMDSTMLTG